MTNYVVTAEYKNCACRDCFDLVVTGVECVSLCHQCSDAGCSPCNGECARGDAYGGSDFESYETGDC